MPTDSVCIHAHFLEPKDYRRCGFPREALEVLKKIVSVPGHHVWPDTLAPTEAEVFASAAFVGHRQVTDAYLLSLVHSQKGKLA